MIQLFNTLQYPIFKLVILALLTLNLMIYAVFDSWIKALDAMVWLALLLLYEMEANQVAQAQQALLNRIRTVLVILVPLVFMGYVHIEEWLDIVNSLFWFALIALLEIEIRRPGWVLNNRKLYWIATLSVFAGLLAMVLAWLWQDAWLDAYDAALWLVAFAAIEADIFDLLKKK